MARPTNNQSLEDYLEAILVVQQRKGHCRSVDVADHLGFTKPSVSVAVSNLTRLGYVHKQANGNLQLTNEGRAYAADVLDRHRLIGMVLTDLGVSPETADADACKIEHDISEETFRRIQEWYAARTLRETPEGVS